jgi:hypothetical protein
MMTSFAFPLSFSDGMDTARTRPALDELPQWFKDRKSLDMNIQQSSASTAEVTPSPLEEDGAPLYHLD